MSRISYSCTALVGTGKAGRIMPDADGYYTLPIGAFDFENASGAFYPLAPAKRLFEASGALMRRIDTGVCKGEYGHPVQEPGMSFQKYLDRILTIDPQKVCCHFRRVWIDETGCVTHNGRTVAAVLAEVCPSGPYGDALKASLDNPSENVYFSIRSLSNDKVVGGKLVKNVNTIVTWDYVIEGGIRIAHKYKSPALEGLEDLTVPVEHLQALAAMEKQQQGLGLESTRAVSIEEILRDMDTVDLSVPERAHHKPKSSKW